MIVSMDTDAGEIPLLRGVIPFAAGTNSHLRPDYEAIDQFAPACICIGLDDSQTFINVANSLHEDIQSNNGLSILNEIPNVGHTVAFSSFPEEMMECFRYIEAQYLPNAVSSVKKNSFELTISPNPSKEILYVTTSLDESIQFSIQNENGTIEKAAKLEDGKIDISLLSIGTKFILFKTKDGKTVALKFVKTN